MSSPTEPVRWTKPLLSKPLLGKRGLLGLAATTLLGGCGFRPMYMPTASGNAGIAQRELAAITVATIPDRPGQLLRQALQERFERAGDGVARLYDLTVGYEIDGEGIAIHADNTTTRLRLIGRADWTLRAQDAGRSVLLSGNARAMDVVNVLQEQYFAADLGNEAAQRRLAEAVAEQITLQLATYFHRRANGTAT